MSGAKRGRGRPRTISDEERSVRITRQARDLFVRKGYADTTMEDIAAACRISKRTLYTLFRGKAEIFGEIIDDHRQDMLALPGDYDGLPVAEALWRIFRGNLGADADYERLAVIRLVRLETERSPELETILRERGGDRSRELLAQWLDDRKRAGLILIDNPWRAAKILMDMIFGAMIAKGRDDVRWPSDEERGDYLRACIDIFTRGVLPVDSAERELPLRREGEA